MTRIMQTYDDLLLTIYGSQFTLLRAYTNFDIGQVGSAAFCMERFALITVESLVRLSERNDLILCQMDGPQGLFRDDF